MRRTGRPVVEGPGAVPVCPSCKAKGQYRQQVIGDELITWWWETEHAPDCAWLFDPNSEAY